MKKLILSSLFLLSTQLMAQMGGGPGSGPGIGDENSPTQTMVIECKFHDDVYAILDIWGTMPICDMSARGITYGTPSYSKHRYDRHLPGDPDCFTSNMTSRR